MSGTNADGFKGAIKLDIRDSVPDWDAFTAKPPRAGSPNVLVVLFDDTGIAAWSPYGGRINMPTMDRLAASGLTYGQWDTTAWCSPTRSCFLTGRNHHLNGFASISEAATGLPGYCSHISPHNATVATVLRDAGWGTYWVRKNHNVPIDAWTPGASRKEWPLAQGFDRFIASSVARPTTGIRRWPRTTVTSTSPTARQPFTSMTRPSTRQNSGL
jgi:arylsulfatase